MHNMTKKLLFRAFNQLRGLGQQFEKMKIVEIRETLLFLRSTIDEALQALPPDGADGALYAIGIEHTAGEMGMTWGPHPSLAEALHRLDQPNAKILRFMHTKETNEPIYEEVARWNEAQLHWENFQGECLS